PISTLFPYTTLFRSKYILTLTSFILFNVAVLYAQAPYGKLNGHVSDANGEPLAGVTVQISDSLDQNGIKTKTNTFGDFSIPNLLPGKHILKAAYVGYRSSSQTVQVLSVNITQVDLVLIQDTNLEEVVITAGRKPESIDEVPSSISILTAREVREQTNINPSVASILGNTIPGLGTATNKATN